MAIIASVFALVGRFVGRVLTTTLGWASILLFGRVPQDRQVWLAAITFGSLAWVATVVGILVPDLGTVLLAAAPLPGWVPDSLISAAMLIAAIALPAVIGGVTLLLQDPEDRPKGRELAEQVIRGYLLVPALALSIVVLAVAGTFMKLNALVHRRQDAHVAMVVRPGRYDALVDTLETTLRAGELVTARQAGPGVLTIPARLLARVSGKGIASLVPDRLIELVGPAVRVAVYPSDLAISGSKDAVPKARALVARDVPSRDAWFTTTKEAQKLEDRLAALETADPEEIRLELPDLDRRLLNLTVDADTFEVLYRRRLQLAIPVEDDVRAAAEPRLRPPEGRGGIHVSIGSIVGAALAVLAGLDLVAAVLLRRSRSGRRPGR